MYSHYPKAHEPPYPWKDRTERGHEWSRQRRKAKERDGFVCQRCGTESRLQVHHKNGQKRDHRLENLLTLCRDCHRKVDDKIGRGK